MMDSLRLLIGQEMKQRASITLAPPEEIREQVPQDYLDWQCCQVSTKQLDLLLECVSRKGCQGIVASLHLSRCELHDSLLA
jgi:hypothetical protein